MKPIALFFHCLFYRDAELLENAIGIVHEQMQTLKATGLLDAATEIHVGCNGGDESRIFCDSILPQKAKIQYHGLQCHNECRTIVMLEQWLKDHPGWQVLYFHSKGATHPEGSSYGSFANRWRRCMMRTCVNRWKECTAALDAGHEAVGAHWLTGQCDGTQHYFAGTFFWATSDYLRTLPSIYARDRIKVSGIDSAESRYEAEVWLGNGSRLPRIKDMETSHGLGGCP